MTGTHYLAWCQHCGKRTQHYKRKRSVRRSPKDGRYIFYCVACQNLRNRLWRAARETR